MEPDTIINKAISVSAEDSGISAITIVMLNAKWMKAEQLLWTDNVITAAPGMDKKVNGFVVQFCKSLTLCKVKVGDNIS